MSASAQSDISISIVSPVSEGDIYRGVLRESPVHRFSVADEPVDISLEQAAALRPLVGHRIWLACIGGQLRFAAVSGA